MMSSTIVNIISYVALLATATAACELDCSSCMEICGYRPLELIQLTYETDVFYEDVQAGPQVQHSAFWMLDLSSRGISSSELRNDWILHSLCEYKRGCQWCHIS
eukprot:m.1310874 g.1310874  ORF g.1310874 m.1310874 type:complete len:104 (-) comp24828_c0_seq3:4573-4884(-)